MGWFHGKAKPTARETTLAVCGALEQVLALVRNTESITVDNDELAVDLVRILLRHFEQVPADAPGGYVTLARKGTSFDA